MKPSLLNFFAFAIMALVTMSPHLVQGTELVCVLGGDLACEINCLSHTGHFAGKCNKNQDCICAYPVDETPATANPAPN